MTNPNLVKLQMLLDGTFYTRNDCHYINYSTRTLLPHHANVYKKLDLKARNEQMEAGRRMVEAS